MPVRQPADGKRQTTSAPGASFRVSSTGFGEVGRSGLRISGGIVMEEFTPELIGDRGRRTLHAMSENDAVISGYLLAITEIISGYNWTIEEDKDAEDEEDSEQKVFIEEAFDDQSEDWSTTLGNILSMVVYGWSYLEIVYKKRQGEQRNPGDSSAFDDGKIGWRKWVPRAQRSLHKWEMDETGGVKGMHQMTVDGPFFISIEKALLFRTKAAGGNPEGKSLIRGAFWDYFFKKRIEEIEAVGIERDMVGMPVGRAPKEWFSPTASPEKKMLLQTLADTVISMHRNELEGLVLPSDTFQGTDNRMMDIELLSTAGTRQFDTDKIIARKDQRMAMSVLADFLLLGHEAVGSKSLGVSKVELFELALQSLAQKICDVVNRHAIPRLLRLNGMPTDKTPKLTFQPMDNTDLAALGSFTKAMVDAGILIPDEGLEEWVRDAADMPPIDQQERLDMFGEEGYVYKQPQPEELQPVLNPDGTQKIDPLTGQPVMGGDPEKFPTGKPTPKPKGGKAAVNGKVPPKTGTQTPAAAKPKGTTSGRKPSPFRR